MRPNSKVLYLSMVIFLLCSLTLLVDKPNSQSFPKSKIATRSKLMNNSFIFDFLVNDDTGSADQVYPAVAIDDSGNFVITWQDSRNANRDIYAQRYNASGITIDSNFRVNDDLMTSTQDEPAIAMDSSGNFVITWWDGRPSFAPCIYAQRYNFTGIPLGSNFRVSEITVYSWRNSPAITMNRSGSFVITWEDWRNNNPGDIYAQRYNSTGTPLSSNFKVNDTIVGGYPPPAIAMDDYGNFTITWQDYHKGDYPRGLDIYAQRYNSSGTRLGSNLKVNDDSGTAQVVPSIATDSSGNFIIAWQDYRNGNWDIYAQKYNSSGTPQDSNFKVNNDTGTAVQGIPAIAIDGSGNFIVAWEDYRNGNWDIYAQRYSPSGNPLGSNYLVNNPQYASFSQQYPVVVINNPKIYFAWQDDRRGTGFDIYAKVVDWTWTEVEEEELANLPNSCELSQNYPNPFNPETTIPFSLKVQGSMFKGPMHTTLKIYNILGQAVRILVDEEKLPVNYKIIWDGKDDSGKEVASGIYFYQLKIKEHTETKKMVLLR
jgi:hypothetical protein